MSEMLYLLCVVLLCCYTNVLSSNSQSGSLFEESLTSDGTVLCGQVSATEGQGQLQVRSRVQCALYCQSDTACGSFNFYTDTRMCQVFSLVNVNYTVLSACSHYQ